MPDLNVFALAYSFAPSAPKQKNAQAICLIRSIPSIGFPYYAAIPSDFRRSDQPQTDSLRSLLTIGHINGDALTFRQAHDPGALQRRGMHENIFTDAIWADEAKPFARIVPLHGTKLLDRGPIGGGVSRSRRICGSLWSRTPRRLLPCGAGVHAQDFRHLQPLRTRPGADLKGCSRWHAAMAAALNHAHVQESVAGTGGQLDKAKPFVGVVPLDRRSDGRAGRAIELWAARRRVSEITGRRFKVVVVETTAAVRAKISVSIAHVSFLGHSKPPDFGVRASDRQRVPSTVVGSGASGCFRRISLIASGRCDGLLLYRGPCKASR